MTTQIPAAHSAGQGQEVRLRDGGKGDRPWTPASFERAGRNVLATPEEDDVADDDDFDDDEEDEDEDDDADAEDDELKTSPA